MKVSISSKLRGQYLKSDGAFLPTELILPQFLVLKISGFLPLGRRSISKILDRVKEENP